MGGKLSLGTTLYPPFISCKLIRFRGDKQGLKCRIAKQYRLEIIQKEFDLV